MKNPVIKMDSYMKEAFLTSTLEYYFKDELNDLRKELKDRFNNILAILKATPMYQKGVQVAKTSDYCIKLSSKYQKDCNAFFGVRLIIPINPYDKLIQVERIHNEGKLEEVTNTSIEFRKKSDSNLCSVYYNILREFHTLTANIGDFVVEDFAIPTDYFIEVLESATTDIHLGHRQAYYIIEPDRFENPWYYFNSEIVKTEDDNYIFANNKFGSRLSSSLYRFIEKEDPETFAKLYTEMCNLVWKFVKKLYEVGDKLIKFITPITNVNQLYTLIPESNDILNTLETYREAYMHRLWATDDKYIGVKFDPLKANIKKISIKSNLIPKMGLTDVEIDEVKDMIIEASKRV